MVVPVKDYTGQELFDTITEHLLTQMKRCFDGESCMYRIPFSNLKCAIGAIIPDEYYHVDMEGYTVNVLIYTFDCEGLVWFNKNIKENIYFLNKLQDLHDNIPTEEWKEKLKKISRISGLKWNFENFNKGE